MVLRYIIGQPSSDTITTERLKLLASGCQLIAVGIFVSSIITPLFNPLVIATLKTHITGGIGFAVFELLAMRVMGYIPIAKED